MATAGFRPTPRLLRSFAWQCAAAAATLLLLAADIDQVVAGHGDWHHKHHGHKEATPAPLLTFDFYQKTCPQLEKIGCDGSVLYSTSQTPGEKDADINFSIGNFFVIDEIKAKLEKVCPDTVSCSDILAATAVYSIKQAGGPLYPIEYGRRDGLLAYAESPGVFLPAFTLKVSGLLENFADVGLDLVDLVTLSGAHTIGQGHCKSIKDRIYPKVDTKYKGGLGQELLRNCTDNGVLKAPDLDEDVQYFMDTVTSLTFDNQYFKNLKHGLGLFTSDIELLNDPRTRALVSRFAEHESRFFEQFGISLRKMGRIGVLTGTQGQIRKQCWVRNSHNQDPAFDPTSYNFTNSLDP